MQFVLILMLFQQSPCLHLSSRTKTQQNTFEEIASWSHERKLIRASQHVRENRPLAEETRESPPRLAVFVTGLQDRLLMVSKIKNVIWTAAKQGYKVDLYVSLVTEHPKEGYSKVKNEVKSTTTQEVLDRSSIESAISGAGNLVVYSLLGHQEKVIMPQLHQKRITEYFNKPYGVNVLRRFSTYETLFNRTVADNVEYDFILVTRDDDHWLGPLNLTDFEKDAHASNTLFTKNCKQFYGINDKTLLFGKKAARAVLGAIYTHFFDPVSSYVTSNAETFLMNFAKNRGVRLKAVAFESIPTADSVYVQENNEPPYLCQKEFYLCANLSLAQMEQPITCPNSRWLSLGSP